MWLSPSVMINYRISPFLSTIGNQVKNVSQFIVSNKKALKKELKTADRMNTRFDIFLLGIKVLRV